MCIFQVIGLFSVVLIQHVQTIEIAREVDGGVELLNPGEVELILPDELSFTIKSPGPFVGKAEFCYAALTTVNKKFDYINLVSTCPEGTCVLLISDEHRAHGLITERRGSVVHYQFKDLGDAWCPRLVVNSRQKFIILFLPQTPVIVNGASLPKDETANATINTKWVILICVVLFLLFVVIVFVGIWICMRTKKKPASVKHVQQVSKSQKLHHLSPRVATLRSNSANNNEDI